MTHPTDDDTFVAFLKTYQPPVPCASVSLENHLMREIEAQPRRKGKKLALLTLGSAILAAIAVGGTIVQRNTPSPQIAISEDLEHFLVEGWEETLGHPLEISSSSTVNEDWLFLEDSAQDSLEPLQK